MDVVIVESPAKAKTINKYLGDNYRVLASYGHIRDLPAKDGSVKPDDEFAMVWQIEDRAEKRLNEIVRALKGADRLLLATDPDREGEAISWHLLEALAERKAVKNIEVQRVVFHEITKRAVLEAVANPRAINQELVDAYRARRALDYLVGFTLSPVLWRKLPGSRSAGRVQSVALRLICEREAEIESFKREEYWTIEVTFKTIKGAEFTARLIALDGKKLERSSLGNEADAKNAAARIAAANFIVSDIEKKEVRRHPQAPFTTSTLQQEASRKLGYGASRTMQIAQKLYEGITLGGETVGLITYMRTDGVQLAGEAIAGARKLIGSDYGAAYLPDQPRVYKTKIKNAQEAHEAIRPTDMSRTPKSIATYLDRDQQRLYELIWKRAVASQMASAVLEQVSVDIAAPQATIMLRANGSIILFDGFFKLYQEGRDDDTDSDESRLLPPLSKGEALARQAILPEQHFTQPPPRYSEASLVKQLEELGIGRPSTYASIIDVLQDRNYVQLEQRRFIPEDRGRLVTAFLAEYFNRYVEYSFTADLESQLDDVSGGRADWRIVLRDFWQPFLAAVDGTKDLKISDVIETLDRVLGPHFFPQPEPDENGEVGRDPRLCPLCDQGRLGLRLGKTGGFIGCSRYPDCRYTRTLAIEGDASGDADGLALPRNLGDDPTTKSAIILKRGPYGLYLQLGEAAGETKPKRASLPPGEDAAKLDLTRALALLSLPRDIGNFPETGEKIEAGIGRFGPYLKLGTNYVSLGRQEDVLSIGLNRATVLIAEAREKAKPLRVIGAHPNGGDIAIYRGRFGPYLGYGKIKIALTKAINAETLNLEKSIAMLAPRLSAAASVAGKAKRGKTKTAKPPRSVTKTPLNGAGKGPSKASAKAKQKKPAPKRSVAIKTSSTPKAS